MANITFLYTTAPDEETARRIARALVETDLAACVNFFPGMKSVYRWDGALEEAGEVAMIVKTTRERAEAAAASIRREHPYETPALAAIDAGATGASPDFAAWIESEVSRL